MHELGITQSIVDACNEEAGGARVARVTVEVGCLSGVLPEAMRFCYALCAEGTALAGSELDIRLTPALATCRDCGNEMAARDYLSMCGCGSANLAFAGGDELRIKEMEMA